MKIPTDELPLTALCARHIANEKKHALACKRHLDERRAILRELGAELKQTRRNTGLTLMAMAKMLKVSRGCLNAAESPESASRYLSPETVMQYAEGYAKIAKASADFAITETRTKKSKL
jgi:DNA-binding XRE family transcriptional regulator